MMLTKTMLKLWCTNRKAGYLFTCSTSASRSHFRALRCHKTI